VSLLRDDAVTVKKNSDILTDASKKVDVEAKVKKTRNEPTRKM
jgi:hypothetical protein